MVRTKKGAFKKTVKKWEEIVEKGNSDIICGFCEFVGPVNKGYCIKGCCLAPDICFWNDFVEESLFKQWLESKDPKIAKKILEAIKVRGKAWVEGGEK